MSIRALRQDGLLQTVAGWIMAGTMLALLTQPLMAALTPFLMLPLWVAYALVGVGLLVAALVRLRQAQLRRAGAVALLLVLSFATAIALGGWRRLAHAGDAVEFRLRFHRLEPQYAALVPELLSDAAAQPGYQTRRGVTFVADASPPKRLAFVQPGGIIDNWEGIIYDPSGIVGAAQGWRYDRGQQEFTAPPAVRGLFGGDIVACKYPRSLVSVLVYIGRASREAPPDLRCSGRRKRHQVSWPEGLARGSLRHSPATS